MATRRGKTLDGGCYCRAVRYRLLDAPLFVNCCHCRQCQSQTGSAFAINAVIETSKLRVRGKVEVISMEPRGAYPHDIHRCAKCHVAVWSDYGRRPTRFVRVATLDDPRSLKPDAHIFTRSKLPWVKLPAGVPAFREFYDLPRLWPKRSLERRAALLAASAAAKA